MFTRGAKWVWDRPSGITGAALLLLGTFPSYSQEPPLFLVCHYSHSVDVKEKKSLPDEKIKMAFKIVFGADNKVEIIDEAARPMIGRATDQTIIAKRVESAGDAIATTELTINRFSGNFTEVFRFDSVDMPIDVRHYGSCTRENKMF